MARARPRYVRHRVYDRLRHSSSFLRWLDAQADRLSSTPEVVFDLLLAGNSFEVVEGLTAVPGAPTNSVLPTITGTARVGQVLTSVTGTWTGSPTYTRQWKKGGVNIVGATGATYTPLVGDLGAIITVTVTATNAKGSLSRTSAPTAAVIAA